MKTCLVCGKKFEGSASCCSKKCADTHMAHLKELLDKAVEHDQGHTKKISAS